jgi:ribonuclease D
MPTNGSVVSVHVITDRAEFLAACETLGAGHGPLAIDAERASGFTYSQRAYLIQIHRRDAGTFLFDPPAIGDMSELTPLGHDTEWVFHAASQDLACLREVGIEPQRIFDTELSARLLGLARVGLGPVMAEILDVHLAKEHSAVDWSTRPLPEPWLVYAVGDVERLVDLRDALADLLVDSDKMDFALEEFEAVRLRPEKLPSEEPWRRLSGLHVLRHPQQLAVARSLWLSRDELARERDVSPGRLIPDAAIVAAAGAKLAGQSDLARLKTFTGRASRPEIVRWWGAIERGQASTDLPALRVPSDTIPHQRSWPDKNPLAALRLVAARERVTELADNLSMPVENLISPGPLREVCWAPPEDQSADALRDALASEGVRNWQATRIAPLLEAAFAEAREEQEHAALVAAVAEQAEATTTEKNEPLTT